MEKKERLYKKIIRLWKQAGLPAFMHRFGPKKYKSVFLAFCWFITQKWSRSLRETQKLLFEFGFPVPHWTTIQKAVRRFSAEVWSLLHRLSIAEKASYICAVDSTGFSLTNPSRHYTNVISGKVACPAKLSVLVDTKTGKSLAFRFRAKRAHDVKDFPYLLRTSPIKPKKIVADSAYDAEEKVFELCSDYSVTAVVKPCRNSKRGFYRKKARRHYDLRTYHRRAVIEGFFSRLKQRFGGSLRCRNARTQRAEIIARVIMQNILSTINRLFLQHL